MNIWKGCLLSLLALGLIASPGAPVWAAEEKADAQVVVPVFTLDGPIVETPMAEDILFAPQGATALKDLLARLKKAREDKNVKAVVLLLDDFDVALSPWANMAQTEELRGELDQIRKAGKDVLAHVDGCSTRTYALLSGCTQVSIVPTGLVMLPGFYVESPYLRGLLDLIGVQPDFMTCGDFKSAAEIFMRKGPSPEAEKMRDWLLDSSFENYVSLVAAGRNVKPEKVHEWVNAAIYTAEKAQKAGIVDKVQHRQDFEADLKKKYGDNVKFDKRYGKTKKGADVDLSSPLGVFKFWSDLLQGSKTKDSTKDAIAIVYVDGPIVQGDEQPSLFGGGETAYSTKIRKALDKAAEDKSVKAVVLRVDSPGGSAIASEIILNASKRVAAKKPLVVSMGNVAASGGYYVACGSETIYADPTTITGSIGVVSGKLATKEMWGKIGISWSAEKRGENAGILTSNDKFTDKERKQMQAMMNEIYGVFKQHVVDARGKRLAKPIDDIAGGRVYTGKQAMELGLVDKMGGLQDAIAFVAEKAEVKDYDIRVMPQPKGFLEQLMEEMTDGKDKDKQLDARASLAIGKPEFSILDLAMPHLKGLDGNRLQAVLAALRRLDLHQREQVLLMTPEISVRN